MAADDHIGTTDMSSPTGMSAAIDRLSAIVSSLSTALTSSGNCSGVEPVGAGEGGEAAPDDGGAPRHAEVAALSARFADLTDDELSLLVPRLQVLASRVSALAAVVAGEWDHRRLWRAEGHRSASSALSNMVGTCARSARRDLRRGRAMRDMPVTSSAVLDGRVTVDHLDLLARADRPWRHGPFLEHELTLVEQCGALRWPDANRVVDCWIQRVDASASAEDARLRADNVHCWASPTLDGQVVVDARLDPIGGEIFSDELHRLTRQQRVHDLRSGAARTPAQLRAAALVEMATRSACRPDGAHTPRPLFTVHVGDDTARHLCQLVSGVVLHPSELVPYVDNAMIETVLFDGPTRVVGVSSRRLFTGVLRRAIVARDLHCTHPSGCDEPAHRCDVDHIVPWALGGPTRQENGRLRCPTHNRHPDIWPNSSEPHPDIEASVRSGVDTRWASSRCPTHDDIAQVRRRWQMRHGLSTPSS